MSNILISAFIGSRNLGDEAIFKSILHNLKIENHTITAVSVNEEKTQKAGVSTLFAKKISQLMKGIRENDIMLIGGGGIIQDQSSILNFLYYSFQIWYAKRKNTPVILNFVGVGPIKFKLSKWIMKQLVPSIAYSIVRDDKSKEQLLKFGASENRVYLAHDPVLNFPYDIVQLTEVYPNDHPYVVVSLRRWFFTNPFLPVFITRNLNRFKPFRKKYSDYVTRLAHDLDAYLAKNTDMKLVLVSLYDGEDDIVNNDLKSLMKRNDRVITAPTNMDEEQYLSITNGAQFVLGMRLHSLVLASTLAKPFVALRYSTKVDEFTEQMGLTNYSIHIERYDSIKLQSALENVTIDSVKLSQNVARELKKYQAHNKKAFTQLNTEISKILKV